MFVDNLCGRGKKVFGFISIEASRANDLFHIFLRSLGQFEYIGPQFEEGWGDVIDSCICALGCEDCGHQQFPGIFPQESPFDLRIDGPQTAQYDLTEVFQGREVKGGLWLCCLHSVNQCLFPEIFCCILKKSSIYQN